MESVYQHAFMRDLDTVGIPHTFHPFGGAANYSLLYLLLRILRECGPDRVLDLGAGQSSLLIDAAAKAGVFDGRTVTVETDADWQAHIRERVAHEVIHTDIADATVEGRRCRAFAHDFAPEERFGLILIDAPHGSRRYSRFGALKYLDHVDRERCVIVIDDANRAGELQTARTLAALLKERGIAFRSKTTKSNKHQIVFGIGEYSHAAFF